MKDDLVIQPFTALRFADPRKFNKIQYYRISGCFEWLLPGIAEHGACNGPAGGKGVGEVLRVGTTCENVSFHRAK